MTPDQRAQLVEAGKRGLVELFAGFRYSDPNESDIVNAVLDALLAFRFPCPECEGTGFGGVREGDGLHDSGCPSCGGSGEADSPRMILAEPREVDEALFPRVDGLLSWAVYHGIDDEWKAEALALSLRFRGLKSEPVFVEMVVPDRNLESDGANPSFVVPDQGGEA